MILTKSHLSTVKISKAGSLRFPVILMNLLTLKNSAPEYLNSHSFPTSTIS